MASLDTERNWRMNLHTFSPSCAVRDAQKAPSHQSTDESSASSVAECPASSGESRTASRLTCRREATLAWCAAAPSMASSRDAALAGSTASYRHRILPGRTASAWESGRRAGRVLVRDDRSLVAALAGTASSADWAGPGLPVQAAAASWKRAAASAAV